MSGAKRRGRPRKVGLFQNGSPPSGRGLSPLGEAVRAGQREFFKDLRKEFRAGTRLSNDMISEVLKYSDGDPIDEVARIVAEGLIASAKLEARQQSTSGGNERSRLNAAAKSQIISDNNTLFEKVRSGSLSANSAAILLEARLSRQPIGGWVPSVRELNMWFKEYRSK